MFIRSWKWEPEIGADERWWGPEIGIEGRFHVCSLSGCEVVVVFGGREESEGGDFGEGAPPIIPPSRNFMVGQVVLNRVAISRAERGEMAFRSR